MTPGRSERGDGLVVSQSGTQCLVGYVVDLTGDDGCKRCYLDLGPQHLNRHRILHGGIAAMLLDVACGNTAAFMFDRVEPPLVLTVSLTTQFVAPARGGRVVATGVPAGAGHKLAHVNGALRDAGGGLIATATGVFKRGPAAPPG